MTLENTVLKKLAEQASASERHEIKVLDAGGWNLYVTAERHDDLSCLVAELALRRNDPVAGGLAEFAQGVSDRTRALTEALRVNEVDEARREALLRTVPIARAGHKLYFEVHLNGTNVITVRRYQVPQDAGQRREQVAFALTHETLARLVGELTGA